METYPATDIRVTDGDSAHATIHIVKRIIMPVDVTTTICGIEIRLSAAEIVLRGTAPLHVRVDGVDTPEMHGEQRAAGKVAKAASEAWFRSAGDVLFDFAEQSKYAGDVVGDFLPLGGGTSLSEYLLAEGLAKPYDGGRKSPWTSEELAAIAARK